MPRSRSGRTCSSGDRPQEGARLAHRRPLDRLLLGILLPIWAVFFCLCVRQAVWPSRIPSVGVSADEVSEYPTLVDFSAWVPDSERSGLELGDRLIQVGDADLLGVGPLGFYARVTAEARYGQPAPRVLYERDGQRGESWLPVHAPFVRWYSLPASFAYAFTSLFISLRARGKPIARLASRALLLLGTSILPAANGGVALNYAGLAVVAAAGTFAHPLSLRAIISFPSEGGRRTAWARFGPWLFATTGILYANSIASFPFRFPVGTALWGFAGIAFFATTLFVSARVYRAADALVRRQIRWVVVGIYGALLPVGTVSILLMVDRLLFAEWHRFHPFFWPSQGFVALLPISLLVAIARYNLFDVDRLLSATASYNAVLVLWVGAGMVLVPWFGEASSRLVGVDPRMGQVALSLALAGLVVPAQRRLRPRIDRWFFRERYAVDHGIADLLDEIARAGDARGLTERTGAALDRLFRPEACVVYAGAQGAFAPIFAAGRPVPPAFEAGSPLVATLRARRTPLALSSAGRTPDRAELGPFDRAALEALGAEVVVPVRRDEDLLAFLCLGPRRSGDVYTATDLSLLAAVAAAVSAQLRRFDQEAVIAAGRAMQESLRRYVPGAVAEELASGIEPPLGEREVTVLFIDLRGYTSFAQARRAEEIFTTVNRYTEAASEAVRAEGGSVVEFNGDGMMAVFGAPRELAHKERAAVAAGREIVKAVSELPVEDEAGAGPLAVGVGIATGPAFVGSLRAVDRLIWTALGATTNLAARLQALTREIDAPLVVDRATWQALGTTAADFELHPAVALRGLRQSEDVYALVGPQAPATRFDAQSRTA